MLRQCPLAVSTSSEVPDSLNVREWVQAERPASECPQRPLLSTGAKTCSCPEICDCTGSSDAEMTKLLGVRGQALHTCRENRSSSTQSPKRQQSHATQGGTADQKPREGSPRPWAAV